MMLAKIDKCVMWDCSIEILDGGRTRRFIPRRDGSSLPSREVLARWRDDEVFRSFFTAVLADVPFSAYRWETPPLTARTLDREFEFVLLDAPGLATEADGEAFVRQFDLARGHETVIAFENLGKDAVLVVPCPSGPAHAYAHLAAFVRHGPEAQRHELWQLVAKAMQDRLASNENPAWLSTAGMGVAWLHVRLDSRPKYYGYRPYAVMR